jgi:FkbM family methyltransferase
MTLRFLINVRNHARTLVGLTRSAGLFASFRWAALRVVVKLGFPEPAMWRIRPRVAAYALQARLRGSSDMQVFEQIFISQEYSCLKGMKTPIFVLDLGANVGFSSAYFLSVFPLVHVIAVEPDDRNVAICKTNLLPYADRALVMHGAVWSKSTRLRLVRGGFRDGREWASQVEESFGDRTSADIQAWDVESLIAMSGFGTIDLLKIDIERAELVIFGASAGRWLHNVRNICIELHGDDCKEAFFAALETFEYELRYSGELTICQNLRRKVVIAASTNNSRNL